MDGWAPTVAGVRMPCISHRIPMLLLSVSSEHGFHQVPCEV